MDGVFINLTDKDVNLIDKDNERIVVPANPDLMTPIKSVVKTPMSLSAVVSCPLSETDIKYLKSAKYSNSSYLKVSRSEKDVILKANMISPYEKYSFTKEQVDKINSITLGRTRLLILTKEDAEFWSRGFFQTPFSSYRLFSATNGELIEYPVPPLSYISDAISKVKSYLPLPRFNDTA
jgi:hypothetical protein